MHRLTCLALLITLAIIVAYTCEKRKQRIESFRSAKSANYVQAGLFSHFMWAAPTRQFAETNVFFNPTNNDLMTTLFVKSNGWDMVTPDYIENISCRDNTKHMPQHNTNCTRYSLSANIQPVKTEHCSVRVFNHKYTFAKTCLVLPVTVDSSMRTVTASLDTYAGSFFMLSRPHFIQSTGTALHMFNPNMNWTNRPAQTIGITANSRAVTNNSIAKTVREAKTFGRVAADIKTGRDKLMSWNKEHSSTEVMLPITLWYMKPFTKVSGFNSTSIVTFYKKATPQTETISELQGCNIIITRVDVTVSLTGSTARFQFDSKAHDDGKFVIITRSNDMLIVCVMDVTGKISMAYFGSLPMLELTIPLSPALLKHTVESTNNIATHLLETNTHTCVPNFADIAIRLGCLK